MTLWGTVTDPVMPGLAPSEPVSIEVVLAPAPPQKCLSEGLRNLYQKCQLYDVMLVAGEQRFPAHRIVLAATSQRFWAELEALGPPSFEEEGPRWPQLVLPAGPAAARALLDSVYGLGAAEVSEEVNVEVLRLAQHFQLPYLEQAAKARLVSGLSTENVVARLAVCLEFNLVDITELICAELVASKTALAAVCSDARLTQHPQIMQELLLRAAAKWKPLPLLQVAPKRPDERPEKSAKGVAIAGA